MKIGRNSPCTCGSGKKYKHCHGKLGDQAATNPSSFESELRQRAEEFLRQHNATEHVRQQQQGFGQPIISTTFKDFRFVGVKNRVFWSKNWLVFTDFLVHFLKDTLGTEWGTRGQQSGSPHPIFRWFEKFRQYRLAHSVEGDRLQSGPIVGFAAATFQLGYALYLIAHHDEIPKRLLKRLRETLTFYPAYYETIVGASLAVAGFEIVSAEKGPPSRSRPEFHATSKASGKVYDVEAKRKERWTAATDNPHDDAFKAELKAYIRTQIYNASRKLLSNPIFWLELNIPTLGEEAFWHSVAENSEAAIRDAEADMTIDGRPIPQAFVVVTNHSFLANEDISGDPTFAFLHAIRTPDYPYGRPVELEEGLQAYDKYRDVFQMMEGWRIARVVPVTFDGSPPELLTADGQSQRTLRIGDTIVVPDMNGVEREVRVEEITSSGDKAAVAVHDPASGQRWIGEVPLTEGEAAAAARYTDAIFGKDNASKALREDDLFDLYNWMLKAYSRSTPDQLAKLIEGDPNLHRYRELPPEEARIRIAREHTKALWVQTHPAEAPKSRGVDGA